MIRERWGSSAFRFRNYSTKMDLTLLEGMLAINYPNNELLLIKGIHYIYITVEIYFAEN